MTRTSWRNLATDSRARRVALDTLAVLALSWATAQHFDSTEWRLVSVFALYKALTESPILEHHPHERERGRVSLAAAACVLALIVAGCLLRPSGPVVRASSYEELVILSEINRW